MERAALVELVRATGCAEECGGAWLLCDPRWGATERAQVEAVKVEIRRAEDGELNFNTEDAEGTEDRERNVEGGKAGMANEALRTEDGGRTERGSAEMDTPQVWPEAKAKGDSQRALLGCERHNLNTKDAEKTENRGRNVESGKAGGADEAQREEDGGRHAGGEERQFKIENRKSKILQGWLGVPTGGTSGRVRFARHDEVTLTAAARGFCAHFGLTRVNAIDVLPAFHVSGLMARVRCAETGGRHVPWDWKRLEAGERPAVTGDEAWVISLVPTQLQRLLGSEAARAWLRGFRIIFVGGGPVWPALMDAAAEARLPISTSYGMTETAAMVAALRPEEFSAGARSSGGVLPHTRIAVGEEGRITIGGESVFRGYFPEKRAARSFETGDLGRFDERAHLHVRGRRDAVIITGGEKVEPAEVEAALRATGQFDDVAVIGLPDPEWGEVVVACFPDGGRRPDVAMARQDIEARLAAFKRPKRYVPIAAWPRNAQGKLNRVELAALATRS